MKETTSAHNRPTFRPDEELVLRARHAIERAITNLTVIRSEPDACDVASGERSAWLLDDLLTVRLQLELLDEDPDLQGGIPHEVTEPTDALRQAVDLCSDEIGDDIGMALGRLEDARRKAPGADPGPLLDQAVMESHNAVTAAFRKLALALRGGDR